MISPKQLKLGASILIGAIMGFAVVSYLIVSSQYEQVSLNDKGPEEEVTESSACQEEVIERYKYVGGESGVKSNIKGHNTVSKMLFLQVSFGSFLMVLAIVGLLVGIVLSIIYNKRAAISLAIAMGVLLIVYLGSSLAVKQWEMTPYQVYQEHAENLMASESGAESAIETASQKSTGTDSDSEDENNLANQENDEPTEVAASPETADCDQDSEEPYTEGLINRAAAGVYTLTAFIILGILAVLFSIFYPVVLTMLPSKK